MKLINLRRQNTGERSSIAADLKWEDCEQSDISLFFETHWPYADALYVGLEPFLISCALPAMYHGEKRIKLEGQICPELKQNLLTAMLWIRHWYFNSSKSLPVIEAHWTDKAKQRLPKERSGFFLSGGVDCLATLKSNRTDIPSNHPASIQDGILIYGQNIESDNRLETFERAFADLSDLADEMNVTLIPVYTNIRSVDESPEMFHINHGAILGSVANALSNRLTRVYVSASDSIPTLSLVNQNNFKPHGSHPVLDPLYSSYRMTIKHDGIDQSRLDKARQIADWDTGLDHIKVCGPNWPGENCCQCEKCVRTMLELLVAGVLKKSQAFACNDVTPEMVSKVRIKKARFGYSVDDDYIELTEPLRRLGRNDLVTAILAMIEKSHHPRQSLKEKIRKLDEQYLYGSLSWSRKKIASKGLTR